MRMVHKFDFISFHLIRFSFISYSVSLHSSCESQPIFISINPHKRHSTHSTTDTHFKHMQIEFHAGIGWVFSVKQLPLPVNCIRTGEPTGTTGLENGPQLSRWTLEKATAERCTLENITINYSNTATETELNLYLNLKLCPEPCV